MKALKTLTLGLVILLFFTSCQKIPTFTAIKVCKDAELKLAIGDKLQVAPDDKDDQVNYIIANGVLTIAENSDAVLYLPEQSYSLITSIEVDTNASVDIKDNTPLKVADVFAINVKDEGELKLNLIAKNLAVNGSGESDIDLIGDTCSNVTLNISDKVEYKAFDLKAKNYILNVTDKAYAEIFANNSITGNISDQGIVKYKGNPATKDVLVRDSAQFINDQDDN